MRSCPGHDAYARAAALTAPKTSARLPGLHVDGYWIDGHRYFFVAERLDPSSDRLLAIPSLADARCGTIVPLLAIETLVHLIRQGGGEGATPSDLADMQFDMPDSARLAVTWRGWDIVIDVTARVLAHAAPSLDRPALYSPDGRFACVVKDHDLWLHDRASGTARALTSDGAERFAYGQETEGCSWAVSYRKCPKPMALWSPDSQWLLTHQIDERPVPDLAMTDHVSQDGNRPIVHRYAYPYPGDVLPLATMVAIHVESGELVRFGALDIPVLGASPFARRTAWFDEENQPWIVRSDRFARTLELIRLDLAAAEAPVVHREEVSQGYCELHHYGGGVPNVAILPATSEVLWWSERDGRGHLYLLDVASGEIKRQITSGDFVVRDVIEVDRMQRVVLFSAGGLAPSGDPARRVLMGASLDGGEPWLIARGDCDVAVRRNDPRLRRQDRPFSPAHDWFGVSPGGEFVVELLSNPQRGNTTVIARIGEEKPLIELATVVPRTSDARALAVKVLAADGNTQLFGTLFVPSDFDPAGRYPLVVCIYPGPQSTQNPQSYRAVNAATAQSLAEIGFVTLMLDTRGTPFRERVLRQAGYGDLLEVQLADHVAVIEALCREHSFLDPDRIGIMGFSGGGFAAARAMLDYPELFKVGVSICGNHDNERYIAFWAEKFCGPDGLATLGAQSSAARTERLCGKLLLVAGEMDENVPLAQTLRLADALIQADRDFDLLIVPNEGHMLLWTSAYVQRQVWNYFVRHLAGCEPPAGATLAYASSEVVRMMARRALEVLW